jgi:hypothetical protein
MIDFRRDRIPTRNRSSSNDRLLGKPVKKSPTGCFFARGDELWSNTVAIKRSLPIRAGRLNNRPQANNRINNLPHLR